MKKLLKVVVVGLMSVALLACTTAGPSDSDARKDAEKVGQAGVDSAIFALDTVVRDNGWQEGEVYTVKHLLTYKAKMPYAEMLVLYAKGLDDELLAQGELQRAASLMGFQVALAGGGATSKQYTDWRDGDGSSPENKAILDAYLKAPVSASGMPHAQLLTLASAALSHESSQVPVGIKKGDPYTYWTTVQYLKTEKGWQAKA